MTKQTSYSPTQQPQVAEQPRNGLGLTGFILGLVGLVLSWIPFIGIIAWPLVALGLVFSAIGLSYAVKGKATNKGLAIAGIVTSIVGAVISTIMFIAANNAVNEVNDEINRVAKVTYELTGDAKNVDVLYGEVLNPSNEVIAELPWTKHVENKGVFKGGTLTATVGEGGGSVTCKITVDGKEITTKTATGPLATAACTGA